LKSDREYARTVVHEFSIITTENALKFGTLSRSAGHYDFSDADLIVDFAEKHGLQVRGHTLLWHSQLPAWLLKHQPTRSELVDILTTHVDTVVRRYAGRIAAWDVVNEALGPDGRFRDNLWYRTIGPEYVDLAFSAARSADPKAQLFYNDYGLEATDPHSEAIYALLSDLRRRNVPVDGVGLQMHLALGELPDLQSLPNRIKRLGGLKLQLAVTEFDVRLALKDPPSKEQFERQATVYRKVLRSCISSGACSSFVFWGFTDRHSWVPHFFPNQGAALLFDEEYRPKPSYLAALEELSRTDNVSD
jgi:endo-1,4-beta-xylanase